MCVCVSIFLLSVCVYVCAPMPCRNVDTRVLCSWVSSPFPPCQAASLCTSSLADGEAPRKFSCPHRPSHHPIALGSQLWVTTSGSLWYPDTELRCSIYAESALRADPSLCPLDKILFARLFVFRANEPFSTLLCPGSINFSKSVSFFWCNHSLPVMDTAPNKC